MAATRTCPYCGGVMPGGALEGLCPKCIGKVTFGLDSNGEPVPPAPASEPAPPPMTVRYFGDYELLEEIARGGMGVVWRARQVSLNRFVAVKMIRTGELASEEEVKRFILEAQAAANLAHPNIVSIYEVGRHEGMHYFSMRLVEGQSLAARMANAESRMPNAEAVNLMATVARAVHQAHQRGILHRDLKPGNILIDTSGEPHVTDFGLAKRVDMPSDLTRTETVMGTPNYMSPEQAQGRNHDLTPASDIFSLGAVLYHLLTGRPPFPAATAWETLKAVVEQEPARPRVLNRRVDRDLETICLKCLEKDPLRRYRSAEALADDLERWIRHEPVRARRNSLVNRTVKWAKRKPAVAALMLAVVLAAAIGLTGWQLARHNALKRDEANRIAVQKTKETADILRANHELLLQQTLADTNNVRGPLWLERLNEAISQQPTNAALWQAKVTVLERSNQLVEAIEALQSAIGNSTADTGVPNPALIGLLLRKSSLLRRVGRSPEAEWDYAQAGRIQCQWKRLPARDPRTRPELVDLSPEWRLVKAPIFAGSAMPATVAVR